VIEVKKKKIIFKWTYRVGYKTPKYFERKAHGHFGLQILKILLDLF